MHIGVLNYLEHIKHKPDIIAGTSAGALVGALYADGYSPIEIVDLMTQKGFFGMTNFQIPRGGMFSTGGFRNMLENNLRHKRIEELPLPLRIVATDLDNGCYKVFTEGSLVDIVVASCSIPVLFNPVIIDEVYYVDGGLFKNFPVSVIRQDCDTVIGVNLDTAPAKGEYKKSVRAIAQRSFDFIFGQNAKEDRMMCDILLEKDKQTNVPMFNLSMAPQLVKMGYDMARKGIEKYKKTISETNEDL